MPEREQGRPVLQADIGIGGDLQLLLEPVGVAQDRRQDDVGGVSGRFQQAAFRRDMPQPERQRRIVARLLADQAVQAARLAGSGQDQGPGEIVADGLHALGELGIVTGLNDLVEDGQLEVEVVGHPGSCRVTPTTTSSNRLIFASRTRSTCSSIVPLATRSGQEHVVVLTNPVQPPALLDLHRVPAAGPC